VLARVRLELPSDVCRTVLWVCLHKQVYVLVRNLQRQNLVSEVVGSLVEQLSHIALNHVENRVAVLETPDEVILVGANRIRVTAVLLYPEYLHL